jgi:hypothetical protein
LDYSESSLGTLRESSLNEISGISQSTPSGLTTVYGPGEYKTTKTGIPINWNRDNDTTDSGVKGDINYMSNYEDCNKKSPGQTLKGYDDWSHIIYDSAIHKQNRNVVAHIIDKLPTITSSLESNYSLPIVTSNITSADGHNQSNTRTELTSNDIKNTNLQLAYSINDAINNITDQRGPNDNGSIKSFFINKIGNTSRIESTSTEPSNVNDTTIIGYLKSDKIDNAITSLTSLLSTMDSSRGGNKSDDKITNSTTQQHLTTLINNAIEILKDQSCRYSECTVVPKGPNETIEY